MEHGEGSRREHRPQTAHTTQEYAGFARWSRGEDRCCGAMLVNISTVCTPKYKKRTRSQQVCAFKIVAADNAILITHKASFNVHRCPQPRRSLLKLASIRFTHPAGPSRTPYPPTPHSPHPHRSLPRPVGASSPIAGHYLVPYLPVLPGDFHKPYALARLPLHEGGFMLDPCAQPGEGSTCPCWASSLASR